MMKRKINVFDDIFAPMFMVLIPAIVLYGVYKFFAGIYYLLDKLIDKL